MKTLAWFLTAAAILIGADVFTSASDELSSTDPVKMEDGPISTAGGVGVPDPPTLQ